MMVSDKVPFRLNWPRHTQIKVNELMYTDHLKVSNSETKIHHRDFPAILSKSSNPIHNNIPCDLKDTVYTPLE